MTSKRAPEGGKVFISYARENVKIARQLAESLEALGWAVFWDRHIPAGRCFSEVIAEQLATANCVITLWSTAACSSDWVQEEAEEAKQRGVLVPAFIERVEPPLGFRRIHGVDLVDWCGQADYEGFQDLLEGIGHYVKSVGTAKPRRPDPMWVPQPGEKFYTYGEEPDDPVQRLTWGDVVISGPADHDAQLLRAGRVFRTKEEAEIAKVRRFWKGTVDAVPVLQLREEIYCGEWQSQEFERPQVIDVLNSQTSVPNIAKSVAVRIKYTHADGTTFTVTEASWFVKRDHGMFPEDGIRSSVDLMGGESQPFCFLLRRKDDLSLWGYKNLSVPIGSCTAGKWTADITITADNANSSTCVVGFTVLPDNRIVYDRPAFKR